MAQISRLKEAEISNGNLINADDIESELDQFISESNSQDTRLTTLESGAQTIAGNKTFSGTVTFANATSPIITNKVVERTSANGIDIDGVVCKDSMVTVSGTPVSDGEIGYASNKIVARENGTNVNFLSTGDVASQAEMEAGSSAVKYAAPSNMHFHPSASKLWGYFTYSGGTPSASKSYNVASVDDDATGQIGVNATTAFSDANICAVACGNNPTGNVDGTSVSIDSSSAFTLKVVGGGFFEDASASLMCMGDH